MIDYPSLPSRHPPQRLHSAASLPCAVFCDCRKASPLLDRLSGRSVTLAGRTAPSTWRIGPIPCSKHHSVPRRSRSAISFARISSSAGVGSSAGSHDIESPRPKAVPPRGLIDRNRNSVDGITARGLNQDSLHGTWVFDRGFRSVNGVRKPVRILTTFGAVLGTAWEPACNRGYMARPMREYFGAVRASDVADYGFEGAECVDFLWPGSEAGRPPINWIVSNPPFRLAEQFIVRARSLAMVGCAMLVRTSFLEGVGRYERLYSVTPPTIVAQFVERLPMVKGRIDRKASTATSYAWLVWMHNRAQQPFAWIPPCRAKLERDSDYPVAA